MEAHDVHQVLTEFRWLELQHRPMIARQRNGWQPRYLSDVISPGSSPRSASHGKSEHQTRGVFRFSKGSKPSIDWGGPLPRVMNVSTTNSGQGCEIGNVVPEALGLFAGPTKHTCIIVQVMPSTLLGDVNLNRVPPILDNQEAYPLSLYVGMHLKAYNVSLPVWELLPPHFGTV